MAALIRYRITELRPDFEPTDEGVLKEVYKAERLMEVIYCHLVDAWAGRTRYYKCAGRDCDNWWLIGSETRGPRPKYCPPQSGSSESLCSRRERYYRSLTRQKKEEAPERRNSAIGST